MADQKIKIVQAPKAASWQRLHDSELVHIHIDRIEKKLLLGFKFFHNNEIRRFLFAGVELFRAVDLIKQNVVSRIVTAPGSGLSREEIANWIRWAASLTDTELLIKDDAVYDYVNRIESDELKLFVLEPSWGSELAIVCRCVSRDPDQ